MASIPAGDVENGAKLFKTYVAGTGPLCARGACIRAQRRGAERRGDQGCVFPDDFGSRDPVPTGGVCARPGANRDRAGGRTRRQALPSVVRARARRRWGVVGRGRGRGETHGSSRAGVTEDSGRGGRCQRWHPATSWRRCEGRAGSRAVRLTAGGSARCSWRNRSLAG